MLIEHPDRATAGVKAVPPLTRIQQSAVLLFDRSDPQVRFVTAADENTTRPFSVVDSKPHRWCWGLRRSRWLQTRRKRVRGSIDRAAAKQVDRWLVELEQGSAGFLTAVRSMKFEDDRFLKETVERDRIDLCGVRGPRKSGRFGQSDPRSATWDLRTRPQPRS